MKRWPANSCSGARQYWPTLTLCPLAPFQKSQINRERLRIDHSFYHRHGPTHTLFLTLQHNKQPDNKQANNNNRKKYNNNFPKFTNSPLTVQISRPTSTIIYFPKDLRFKNKSKFKNKKIKKIKQVKTQTRTTHTEKQKQISLSLTHRFGDDDGQRERERDRARECNVHQLFAIGPGSDNSRCRRRLQRNSSSGRKLPSL